MITAIRRALKYFFTTPCRECGEVRVSVFSMQRCSYCDRGEGRLL
jgi:hypothetical protein